MPVRIGQTATRSLQLTREHVEYLVAVHQCQFWTHSFPFPKFGRLVVQGGLTTGVLHALVAMDMPGPGTVFLSQDWKFTAPVFIGDTITATAEVLKVHDSKPVTRLGIKVVRDGGEIVLEGEAWCYTFTPAA